MSTRTSFAVSSVPAASWQAGFLSVLPAIQTHATIKFRRLRAERREEAIQEAIAAACVSYQLLAVQGRLHVAHASTLADYAVKHVRSGRHIGGAQDAAKDVLSPAAALRHGVRAIRFSQRGSGGMQGWRRVVVEGRGRVSIADLAAFRVDFARFLKTLGRRDQRVIDCFVRGDRTGEVAAIFGLTPGRISQLRTRFERQWRNFQGEGGPNGMGSSSRR
jgi:hypothetical protein